MISLLQSVEIKLGIRCVSGSISSGPGFPRLSQRFRTTPVRRRRSSSCSCSSTKSAMAATDSKIVHPPVAKKVKHELQMFGDVRVDNYYWLRDDSRSDPEMLDYIRQENAYTDFIMSETKHLKIKFLLN
ncbi:hypothetical protein R6Q59_010879 [Mikania micrantha]